jgi:septal ring factor EnvC (AmiA/AmiB activator)
MNQKCDVKVT